MSISWIAELLDYLFVSEPTYLGTAVILFVLYRLHKKHDWLDKKLEIAHEW